MAEGKPSKLKTPALDSLEQQITERYQTEQNRIKALRTQKSLEKSHSQYLRSRDSHHAAATYNFSKQVEHLYLSDQNQMENSAHGTQQNTNNQGLDLEATQHKHDKAQKSSKVLPGAQVHGKLVSSEGRSVNSKPESILFCNDNNNNSNNEYGKTKSIKKVTSSGHPSSAQPSQSTSGQQSTSTSASISIPASDGVERVQPTCRLVCPVLMCPAEFSTEKSYNSHISPGGNHSPCNPCYNLMDGLVPEEPLAYCCPVCGKSHKTEKQCQSHLDYSGHGMLGVMPPIPISAYCCPDCLKLFSDRVSCFTHIQDEQHFIFKYSHHNDPGLAEPVLVPSSVVRQFLQECGQVEWHMECIDCGHHLLPEEDLVRLHINKFHSVMALTNTGPEEVFRCFVKKYSCVQCLRLFAELPPGGLDSLHQCSANISGLIIENDSATFQDLVLRNGLNNFAAEVITVLESPVPTPAKRKIEHECTDPTPAKRKIDHECTDQQRPRKLAKLCSDLGEPVGCSNQSLSSDQPSTSGACSTVTVGPSLASNRESYVPAAKPGSSLIPSGLADKTHILFLDLDNWAGFFKKLLHPLPNGVFVWAFYGGKYHWNPPKKSRAYKTLVDAGCFHLHDRCGTTKDAADFAMVLYIGKMDERLPEDIPFTILSGDKGFCELERQMKSSNRRAVVINPHHCTEEEVYVLIDSVTSV